jgi:hypothetical protein
LKYPSTSITKLHEIIPNLNINNIDNTNADKTTMIPEIKADELFKKKPKSQKICLIPLIA